MFTTTWHQLVSTLGEGLDDDRRCRLNQGLDYYRKISNELFSNREIDLHHLAWLDKAAMPIWTSTVHGRHLFHIVPETVIDELLAFLELKAKKVNGNDFGYIEQLSSSSTDAEADQMCGFTLDFVEFCSCLYRV